MERGFYITDNDFIPDLAIKEAWYGKDVIIFMRTPTKPLKVKRENRNEELNLRAYIIAEINYCDDPTHLTYGLRGNSITFNNSGDETKHINYTYRSDEEGNLKQHESVPVTPPQKTTHFPSAFEHNTYNRNTRLPINPDFFL